MTRRGIEQTREILRRTDAGGLIVCLGVRKPTNDAATANQERFVRTVMSALTFRN
jgi:hypothetical protein